MNNDRKKIIIVDDNLENLTAIKNTLKDIYDVYPSSNASKMFDLMGSFLPDLILLDVDMPGINGYEAAKMLKHNEKYREIPVIFLTSMNDAESEYRGLSLGAVDYIHKPFVSTLLLKRIETHLTLIDVKNELQELFKLKTREAWRRKSETERALKISQIKGEFLSRMNQEIRTPLNAIIGMIGIASGTDDIKKIKYCLNRAGNASKHLLGIVNNILDMSKIEEDKFELSYSEFDFEKMLMSVNNVTNVHAEEKSQEIVIDVNPNVPAFIVSDELRLSQVITNLLTNAIKFTPENGRIKLSVEKIAASGGEITLKFEVADNGIGISTEQQKRLLTSYGQGENGAEKNPGASGLGLAITRRIVALMHGSMWIESEINKGSKFIFTARVKKGADKQYARLSGKINREDIRILAVDDSVETRAYFTRVMEACCISSETAATGAEAVEMINKNTGRPFNIFFVDWNIPDMGGIELVKKIREIDKKSIVVMFSMTDRSGIENEAVAAGVKYFISKPLFQSTLINVINDCIDIDSMKTARSVYGPDNEKYNFTGYTILVVEDVEINREILLAVLERTGISVDFAGNGLIAVSMFENNPVKYSLIVMDIDMPEMDGYKATESIRSLDIKRAKSIPIIAMTAKVFREDIESCLAAGMNDHIGKPIDQVNLLEKIDKYVHTPV
ncbi:MAG: response regulator [Treponema sp.]|nr:response regulator [Treponema sp.]